MSHTSAIGLCLTTALRVAAGATVIGGLAGLAARLTRSAVWQRTIWQAAVLGVFSLLAVELTGTSAGLWQWMRQANLGWGPARTAVPRLCCTREKTTQVRSTGFSRKFAATPPKGGTTNGAFPTACRITGTATPGATGSASASVGFPGRWPPRVNSDEETSVGADVERTGNSSSNEAGLLDGLPIRPTGGQGFWTQARAGTALALVWWLGAAGLVVRTICVRVLLGRFRRLQAACDDPAVARRVQWLARRLRIQRAVDVRTSHTLAAPVAFGVLRPVLVLPPAFGERFDRGQQEAILAHELATWRPATRLGCWGRTCWRPCSGGSRWPGGCAADCGRPAKRRRTKRVSWFPTGPIPWQPAWWPSAAGWRVPAGWAGCRWPAADSARAWAAVCNGSWTWTANRRGRPGVGWSERSRCFWFWRW